MNWFGHSTRVDSHDKYLNIYNNRFDLHLAGALVTSCYWLNYVWVSLLWLMPSFYESFIFVELNKNIWKRNYICLLFFAFITLKQKIHLQFCLFNILEQILDKNCEITNLAIANNKFTLKKIIFFMAYLLTFNYIAHCKTYFLISLNICSGHSSHFSSS